jgi:hypothetical protein
MTRGDVFRTRGRATQLRRLGTYANRETTPKATHGWLPPPFSWPALFPFQWRRDMFDTYRSGRGKFLADRQNS